MRHLFAAIDLETTGLDFRKHCICQFGCTLFTKDKVLVTKAWDVYVSQTAIVEASEDAIAVNGMTARRMLAGTDIEIVLRDFERLVVATRKEDFCGEAELMAVFHNAPFDVPFIRRATHLPEGEFMDRLLRRVLDTVTMGFLNTKDCGARLSLASLCEVFLAPETVASWKKHDAADDSYFTAILSQVLMKRLIPGPGGAGD